jgi:AraC family transcriptional regulator of adaptative response/methylated-DNA-[protein]-cysteine methyltransferase
MQPARIRDAVVEACRLLEAPEAVQTRELADAVGLSRAYFQRSFKKQLGVTPQQYRRRVLAERARTAMAAGGSITRLVYDAGYSSSSRFYEGIGRELGMKPSVARAGGIDERIEYGLALCSLGVLLVAWTERGVCEVAFGEGEEALVTRLRTRFPRAELRPADGHGWVESVVAAVEHASPTDIPLDIRGTAFQERVWQALRAIPAGQTRTYSQIAETLGCPGAARAVARACATNDLAVLVPCHRVVAKNGSLSGYRWGMERKRELLRRERALSAPPVEKR